MQSRPDEKAPRSCIVAGATRAAILDNGTQIGTAQVTNGSWSTTVTLPSQGANAITATDTDAAGNTGTSAPITYTLDTFPPTVSQAVANPATGDEGIDKTIQISLTFSEPVTVSNSAPPALTLNDGGSAAYSSGSGTNTLIFAYTVGSSDTNTNALSINAVTNGSSITDAAGNTANTNGAIATFAGLQVDTVVPAVTAVAASPSSGVEYVGSTVTISLALSEAVAVSGGTPTLSLNDGGVAKFQAVSSDGKTLTFSYTVGQSDTSLSALAVTAFNPNGATIADAAGNAASLSAVSKTFSGLQINTTTPVITKVLTSPSSGDIGLGKNVTITVDFSQNVTVKGTPKLTLNDGGSATYSSGTGTSALTFTYTVATGQNTTDLQATGITLPSGASIKSSSGQTANLSAASVNLGLEIDSTKPAITAVSASTSTGDLNAGKTVVITLTTSEPVVVTGSPSLTLNDGGTAAFNAAKSTATSLVFDYTVASGQNTTALKVSTLSIPSGSSIQDLAGNSLTATLPASAALGLQIDTKAPTVTGESAAASSKDLNAGKTAQITLTMSEPVTVAGKPTLTLNDGGGTATYDPGLSSATSLTFDYTVLVGQNTMALKITGFGTGGSIQDLAGNAVSSTIPSTNLGLQVDTVTPTVSSVSSSHPQGTAVGNQIAITLKMNEAVTVSGTPELLLNNGGVATYNPTASTSTSLVFDYTIAANQGTGTTPLTVLGAELSSPGAIQDGAGNVGALTLTSSQANLGFKITSTPAGSPASLTISGTSEAELFGASAQNVTFASGADGTLKLDAATAYTGSISGLALGDTLDLASLAYVNGAMTAAYSATTGTVTVSNGTNSVNLKLAGNYSTSTWTLSGDGSGGTDVVDPPASSPNPADGGLSALVAQTGVGAALDLSGMVRDAHAMLAFSPGSQNAGGLPSLGNGALDAAVALLGNYTAPSFTLGANSQVGANVEDHSVMAAFPLIANPLGHG